MDADKKTNKITLDLSSSEAGVLRYNVEIKTANDLGAGTDAKVKLSLIGDQTVDFEMNQKDATTTNKDIFEKGQIDLFAVYGKEISGPLKRIIIGHDGKGMGGDWKLEHVKISYKTESYK